MKLIKTKSREKDGVEYFQYRVVLPKKMVERLNWSKGEELEATMDDEVIKIESKEKKEREEKNSVSKFGITVRDAEGNIIRKG